MQFITTKITFFFNQVQCTNNCSNSRGTFFTFKVYIARLNIHSWINNLPSSEIQKIEWFKPYLNYLLTLSTFTGTWQAQYKDNFWQSHDSTHLKNNKYVSTK